MSLLNVNVLYCHLLETIQNNIQTTFSMSFTQSTELNKAAKHATTLHIRGVLYQMGLFQYNNDIHCNSWTDASFVSKLKSRCIVNLTHLCKTRFSSQ